MGIKDFQKRQEMIQIVRSKTFRYSMDNIIDELRTKMDSDEIDAMLDAQGAQEDADVDEEGLEEIDRHEIEFSQ